MVADAGKQSFSSWSPSCQWSPHPVTSNLILTTSSQKLLIWDLRSTSPSSCLSRLIFAHARSITDINWHARDPNLMATTSIDGSVKGWDLRVGDNNRAVIRLADWGDAGTQVKWNRQHDYMIASAHGNRLCIWDTRVCRPLFRRDPKVLIFDGRKEQFPSRPSRRMTVAYTASIGTGARGIKLSHVP